MAYLGISQLAYAQISEFKIIASDGAADVVFAGDSLSIVLDRPMTQAFYVTPEGHFKIHYDTTGNNAIQVARDLGKDIPDWIYYTGQAYERGWNLLIDSLNYRIPPVDTVDGNEIDIYIQELSNSFIYGQVLSDSEFVEDTINVSYIEMDNDFSEIIYFSNGLDGMRVTAMHLLFHVIQLGYTFRISDIWFFELSSTWFEDVGYDNVNDYIQYINLYYDRGPNCWKRDMIDVLFRALPFFMRRWNSGSARVRCGLSCGQT